MMTTKRISAGSSHSPDDRRVQEVEHSPQNYHIDEHDNDTGHRDSVDQDNHHRVELLPSIESLHASNSINSSTNSFPTTVLDAAIDFPRDLQDLATVAPEPQLSTSDASSRMLKQFYPLACHKDSDKNQ